MFGKSIVGVVEEKIGAFACFTTHIPLDRDISDFAMENGKRRKQFLELVGIFDSFIFGISVNNNDLEVLKSLID